MNPLGLLGIVFVVMCVAAVLALALLFLIKDEKKKKYIVYFMAALGLYIAWANAQSSPLPQYLGEAVFGWILGAAGLVGAFLQMKGTEKRHLFAAKFLVAIAVVAGIVELFFH